MEYCLEEDKKIQQRKRAEVYNKSNHRQIVSMPQHNDSVIYTKRDPAKYWVNIFYNT